MRKKLTSKLKEIIQLYDPYDEFGFLKNNAK